MECTVTWTGAAGTRSKMGFVAETGSGHVIAMDGAPDAAKPENGGQNLAPRPMETLLAGTGGCTAYDVVEFMKKRRTPLHAYRIEVEGERAESAPQRYTVITVRHIASGEGVTPDALERAAHLSHEKYCSVAASLNSEIRLETRVEPVGDTGA